MKSIDEYLDVLKNELRGSDPALIQDALSDAEEYLRTELDEVTRDHTDFDPESVLDSIISKYGTPAETAEAYRDMERRTFIPKASVKPSKSRPHFSRFFGVLTESQAWSAVLYMVISLMTGMIYFSWAMTGTVLSLSLLIFIIGLPVTGLFLLSLRGISLLEGKIVEALLGERMPRKPIFVYPNTGLKDKFKQLVTDSHTWKTLVYLVFHFPLGFFYSCVIFIGLGFSIKAITYPFWKIVLGRPLFDFYNRPYYPTSWQIPLVMLAGLLVFPLILHFAKLVAGLHRRYAKSMLVRK